MSGTHRSLHSATAEWGAAVTLTPAQRRDLEDLYGGGGGPRPEDARLAELRALARGQWCVRCRSVPRIAWLGGEYLLRCECQPIQPTLARHQPEMERLNDMVSSAVAKRDPKLTALTALEVIRTVAPKATPTEAEIFVRFCQSEQLNPWAGEAYLVPYGGKSVIQIGVNAYARRASENPIYAGMKSGVLVMRGGDLVRREGTFTLPGDALVGGWCDVFGKGWAAPYSHTVKLEDWDRTRKGQKGTPWESIPATMIKKVAESQALRRAMPKVNIVWSSKEIDVYNEGEAPAPLPVEISGVSTHVDATATPAPAPSDSAPGEAFNGYCPVHKEAFALKEGTKNNKPYKFWACPTKDGAEWCKRRPQDWLTEELKAVAPELVETGKTGANVARFVMAENWAALEKRGMAAVLADVKALKAPPAAAPEDQGEPPADDGSF